MLRMHEALDSISNTRQEGDKRRTEGGEEWKERRKRMKGKEREGKKSRKMGRRKEWRK